VMVDGSMLSFEENVELTKRIVGMAHAGGVCVEAELGQVSRDLDATADEIRALMTDPKEAREFVSETAADYLAVSVGSVSGFYRGSIKLDFDRLAELAQSVPAPLVLHGGTSIPAADARRAVRLGVCKINVAHGLRRSFVQGLRRGWDTSSDVDDPRTLLDSARLEAKEFVKCRMRLRSGEDRD